MRALVCGSLLLCAPAFAGGYAISEHDAEATGRGGTGVAATRGPSALQYNPALLSRQFSLGLTVGGTGILPLASATDPSGGPTQQTVVGVKTPPHVYAGYGNGKWGVALGFNAPFGGGLRWGEDFRGRFEILEQKLEVLAGHLGGAYQLTDELSVGANVTVYGTSVGVERRIDFVDSEGTAQLAGDGVGFGASAGVSWAPTERVRFGLTGRLPTTVALSGRAHFADVPDAFAPLMQDQAITASLPLPARVALGGGYYFDRLRVFADLEYTAWSAFDRFAVDFEEAGTPDVDQARHWKDTFGVRLGVEHDLNPVTVLRAGALFDQHASPADTLSPSLPDSDRLGLTLGAGRDFGFVAADVSYMFIHFLPRTAEGDAFPARYEAQAHLIALTLRLTTPPGVANRSADTSRP